MIHTLVSPPASPQVYPSQHSELSENSLPHSFEFSPSLAHGLIQIKEPGVGSQYCSLPQLADAAFGSPHSIAG